MKAAESKGISRFPGSIRHESCSTVMIAPGLKASIQPSDCGVAQNGEMRVLHPVTSAIARVSKNRSGLGVLSRSLDFLCCMHLHHNVSVPFSCRKTEARKYRNGFRAIVCDSKAIRIVSGLTLTDLEHLDVLDVDVLPGKLR